MSAFLPKLYAGVYQHYKGQLYQVLGYSQDSSNHEDPQYQVCVVYIPLYLADGLRIRHRNANEFHEWVHQDTGLPVSKEDDMASQGSAADLRTKGYRPRFEYIGAQLEQEDVDDARRGTLLI